MTAILAVRGSGQTWIASDGCSFAENLVLPCGPKFFVRDGWGAAHCWSVRAWQVIEARKDEFKTPDKWDMRQAQKFSEWVKNLMEESGGKKESEKSDLLPSHPVGIILATKNMIFRISGDASVSWSRDFLAMGAGEEYAHGAMSALWERGLAPREIAEAGIGAAKKFSPWVRGKIHMRRIS